MKATNVCSAISTNVSNADCNNIFKSPGLGPPPTLRPVHPHIDSVGSFPGLFDRVRVYLMISELYFKAIFAPKMSSRNQHTLQI